jgi:arsenite methyltransferase
MKHTIEEKRTSIQERYATIALKTASGGCCAGGCNCDGSGSGTGTGSELSDAGASSSVLGYSKDDIASVPQHANMGLGCGNPLALADVQAGEVVLDLGSGGGFDCFLARRKVGETGRVIGVDMTAEMIALARKNALEAGYTNVEFRLGEIEHLPVADSSVDLIISNCVVNLSLDKKQVFKEAYRVLKRGGRLAISDIVATAQLPEHIQQDLSMLAGCVSGAEHFKTIEQMLIEVGFTITRMEPKDSSKKILRSWAPDGNLQDYVASFIIHARKD